MERINVSMPNPVIKKLRQFARNSDLSLSASALKLIEIGLVSQKELKEKNRGITINNVNEDVVLGGEKEENITRKINELTIQNAVILREIVRDGFDFDEGKLNEIRTRISSMQSSILDEND